MAPEQSWGTDWNQEAPGFVVSSLLLSVPQGTEPSEWLKLFTIIQSN